MRALGIDIGSTNIKVALVDVDADRSPKLVRLMSSPTPSLAGELLSEIEGAVRELCRQGRPEAVGIASMAESGVPLDATGEALAPIMPWTDQSAAPVVEELVARLGRHRAFDNTGVRISAKTSLTKWLWLGRQHPDRRRSMRWWAGTADLVAHALTGSMITDHTLAGRTGAWLLETNEWWPDALAAVGLAEDQLPHVHSIGQSLPQVRPGPFTAAGLPAGIPVVVAGHDHAVGAYAVGVRAPGSCADSLGTAEAVYTILEVLPAVAESGAGSGTTLSVAEACIGPGPGGRLTEVASSRSEVAAEGMSLVRTVSGDCYAVVGGAPSAGALIGWWRALGLPVPDDVEPDAAGPMALPYLTGRQCPSPSPGARLAFVGIRPDDNVRDLYAGMLLGLSLHARWIIETHRRWLSRPIADLTVLGGPSANTSWVRHKAAVGPAPVRRASAANAVVLGAAMIAAELTAGVRPLPLPAEPVDSDRAVRWENRYRHFVECATAH